MAAAASTRFIASTPPVPPAAPAADVQRPAPPAAGAPRTTAPAATTGRDAASGARGGSSADRRSAAPEEHVVFSQSLKVVVIDGRDVKDPDVILSFIGGQISVAPKMGGTVIQSLPYTAIRRATHVYAKDPMFDRALAAPPVDTKFPRKISHHWLVLQNNATFMILRLDANLEAILATVAARTRLKITEATTGR